MGKSLPVFYDCHNCPAYCCTYPRIEVRPRDLTRIAKHFGIGPLAAKRRFTKEGSDPGEVILRHRKDDIYGSACRFLDVSTRMCTIHEARPDICREHPGGSTCAYYGFLMAERRYQNDPEFVARAYNAD